MPLLAHLEWKEDVSRWIIWPFFGLSESETGLIQSIANDNYGADVFCIFSANTIKDSGHLTADCLCDSQKGNQGEYPKTAIEL